MDFEQLKKVDGRTKDIVCGYIRKNKWDNVPSLVIHCILAFYWLKEYFEKKKIDQSPEPSLIQFSAISKKSLSKLIIPHQR